MAKCDEYFQGAATATAGNTVGKRGQRRTAIIDNAHQRIRNQGIKRDAFEALVVKAEKAAILTAEVVTRTKQLERKRA
jgi:hypothetical protein